MTAAWEAESKLGHDRRPTVRATIQVVKLARFQYDKGKAPGEDFGHQFEGKGNFTSILFAQNRRVQEIPNILGVSWGRSVEQDVAECTLTILNTRLMAMGEAPEDDPEEFDRSGFLSPDRGKDDNPWGYEPNAWRDILVPDRLVKTYEGYGADFSETPSNDPHLMQSGAWLIDEVSFNAAGNIEVKMRDVGRLLIDQIVFPPLIPYTEYPMRWARIRSGSVQGKVPTGGQWGRPAGECRSSNDWFVGQGLTNEPHKYYVNQWGNVDGHRAADGYANRDGDYWSSTGQPSARSTVWWQLDLDEPTGVRAIQIRPKGGPYRVYVSLRRAGEWIGKKTIPYDRSKSAGEVNAHADIPFVASFVVQGGARVDHLLKRAYGGVDAVRLTFTRLRDTGVGKYPFRAELWDVKLYTGNANSLGTGTGTSSKVVGNYRDYTDIVKWCCAWAGWYWPSHSTSQDFMRDVDGTKDWYTYTEPDPKLPSGRAWGDFMNSGTAGVADLTPDLFDKQPFMNVISYVRDTLGFLFFIDETGAPVWRLPNLWGAGNYRSPGQKANRNTRGRTSNYVELVDDVHIRDFEMVRSSRELRERVFVGNATGKIGTVVRAFKPFAVGFRRVAGWCVDEETEIFTRRGWLRWNEVRAGDETLSLGPDGLSTWQAIREVATFAAEPRTMVKIQANNFDALTTPNHRWLVERYSTTTKTWTTRYVTTDHLTAMDRIKRSAPGGAAGVRVHEDALVELVGWLYTEGAVRWKGRSPRSVIYQSPSANPGSCDRIRMALKSAFGEAGWSEVERKGCIEFRIGADATRTLVAHLGSAKEPTMAFLTSLTQDQLELFVDVSIEADGWTRKTTERSGESSRFFAQNVGPRLDAFLAACALAGLPTSVHYREGEGNWFGRGKVGHVTVLQNATACIGQMERVDQDHDGIIWCPAMPQHHNWLARRGGAVFFTGNTDQNFETNRETYVMGDMIAARQMFTYRTTRVTIDGYPAIQIDDQIKLSERTTGETYWHYVQSISSDLDMEAGTWTYQLETHWLGEEREDAWVVDSKKLHPATENYLELVDKGY